MRKGGWYFKKKMYGRASRWVGLKMVKKAERISNSRLSVLNFSALFEHKGRPANGRGVVLKFRTFPYGGRGGGGGGGGL